jgi:hypothetical protein
MLVSVSAKFSGKVCTTFWYNVLKRVDGSRVKSESSVRNSFLHINVETETTLLLQIQNVYSGISLASHCNESKGNTN